MGQVTEVVRLENVINDVHHGIVINQRALLGWVPGVLRTVILKRKCNSMEVEVLPMVSVYTSMETIARARKRKASDWLTGAHVDRISTRIHVVSKASVASPVGPR